MTQAHDTAEAPKDGWTPGPWATNCSHIYAPDGEIIAVVFNPGKIESDYPLVANRNLMAAAPDMAEALAAAEQFIENGIEFGYIRMPSKNSNDSALKTLPMIRAALAKAHGDAS